jgi:glutamine amidotransferase
MIKIIDYGLGNTQAFQNVYKRINIESSIARTTNDLRGATKLILPGVGAFDHAIELLDRSGMRTRLEELVLGDRVPVLGVCVGMQILARASDEGRASGLGWIGGHVTDFRSLGRDELHLPHMGWNDVRPVTDSPLFADLRIGARFYFLHSYFFACEHHQDVAAISTYGTEFSCAIQRDNVYGVQFHPEKSHHFGTQLLRNFAEF